MCRQCAVGAVDSGSRPFKLARSGMRKCISTKCSALTTGGEEFRLDRDLANREEYSHSKKIENSAGEWTAEVLNGTGLPRGALWASPQNELAAILGLMAFLHMKVNAVQQ